MLNVNLNVEQEFHPWHFRFPQNAITPQTGNTSLSQSAGAVWGDRHCPLRLLASVCISCQIKGILQIKNI